MTDRYDDYERPWSPLAVQTRVEGIVRLDDRWIVTGFIPYEGVVMLAAFHSSEHAIAAVSDTSPQAT
jgi:hypothetical protein